MSLDDDGREALDALCDVVSFAGGMLAAGRDVAEQHSRALGSIRALGAGELEPLEASLTARELLEDAAQAPRARPSIDQVRRMLYDASNADDPRPHIWRAIGYLDKIEPPTESPASSRRPTTGGDPPS